MEILLIARSFYPIISPRSFRATELSKELSKQGHKVTVATFAHPSHKEFEVKYGVRFKYLSSLKWKDIDISGGSISSKVKRGLRRFLQLAVEYPSVELVGKVTKFINYNENKYDAIISIAVPYPIHWGVAASNWKRIANTWIADCGDPYYGDTSDSFKKWFYFKYIEKWAFKKMDAITVPLEEAKNAYFSEFRHKIHIIPQGFDFSIPKAKYIPNPVPTFIYAGGFIPGYRDPQPFLDYLSRVEKDFKFIIYTKNANLLRPYINKLNHKLIIKDYIPREELMLELSKADFLININNAASVQSPSKLIDYKIAGRPILNVEYGQLNTVIINQFLEGNYENQLHIEDLEKYDIRNVAKEFIKLI